MQQIQGDGFNVTVIKSDRRKTTALKIKNGEVSIHTPKRLPISIAQQFVKEKTAWIKQKLEQQSQQIPVKKRFTHGEIHCYLGKEYPLQLIDKAAPVSVIKNRQVIEVRGRLSRLSKAAIRAALITWYKQQASHYLSSRTASIAARIGLLPKSVTVKTYTARWGSCGVHADIQYNWKLMLAPPDIIDYVIIHELCHIQHHNHSAQFWKLVEQHSPLFKDYRLWLKNNGYLLEI